MDGSTRLETLIQSIEEETQKSGIRVDCSELKTQLNRLREKEIIPGAPVDPSASTTIKDHLKVNFHLPVNAKSTPDLPSTTSSDKDLHLTSNPQTQASLPKSNQQPNPRDWASLFRTQGPSRVMKLSHYPELQQEGSAVVELVESDLNDKTWNFCLIGYFLDGKMPFPLLSATARKIWKDYGKINIKQIGACYFFEFQDEETKLKVLEGGPYFFSRRYLVLKDWHRMLVPSTVHPATIPAWVKLHKLPLECWTEECFSRIASTIGKTSSRRHSHRQTAED